MPAVTSPNILALPAVQASADQLARSRPVRTIVTAIKTYEGEGFPVRRPFPGLDRRVADPFLLLLQGVHVRATPTALQARDLI